MLDGHTAGHCVNGDMVAQKPTILTKIRILGNSIAHTHNAILWSPGKVRGYHTRGNIKYLGSLKVCPFVDP